LATTLRHQQFADRSIFTFVFFFHRSHRPHFPVIRSLSRIALNLTRPHAPPSIHVGLAFAIRLSIAVCLRSDRMIQCSSPPTIPISPSPPRDPFPYNTPSACPVRAHYHSIALRITSNPQSCRSRVFSIGFVGRFSRFVSFVLQSARCSSPSYSFPFIICLRIPCVLLFWLVLLFPLTQYRWSNVGLIVFYLLVLHRNGSDLFCGAKAEVKLLLSGVVHGCTYMMDASDYSYNLGCDF
jgi:hypothetical protein